EFISMPFQRQIVYESLVRVKEILDRHPINVDSSDLVFTFLPSKPGVGTTTIAANAALVLARMPNQRSLLMDSDTNSGMVRFLLQLENNYSLLDAAERALFLDENIWPQLVTPLGNLDVLHSGKLNPEVRVEASHLRNILDFVRRQYKAVIVDTSGNLDRCAIEAMLDSKRIFLVVTPEVPSLHLAREKLAYLKSVDLGDRVAILLNRCQKRAIVSPAQVEDLLGQPVLMTFANDYQGVHKAMTAGKAGDPNSELGRQLGQLAQYLMDRRLPGSNEGKKRLGGDLPILPSPSTLP